MNSSKQKWIIDDGVFYPIPGDTTLHLSPGPGVFQLYKNPKPQDGRIGLMRMGDKFEFDYKIYDLGSDGIMNKVEKTWNSDYYIKKNCNLGVIFNGLKGTGKTVSAKLLCNRLGLPVIVVPYCCAGILDFLQSIEYECVILIDEAEKTFKDTQEHDYGEVLLKLIDGVYNRARKLYILTTNRLTINENLIGRPGRIRYIKEFGNLTEKAVNDYIDDNLLIPEKKNDILKTVDLLEISTIDILRSIVDEVNIQGEIPEDSDLNIPKASHVFKVLMFPNDIDEDIMDGIKKFITPLYKSGKLLAWLEEKTSGLPKELINLGQVDDECYDSEDETVEDSGDLKPNRVWFNNQFGSWETKITSTWSSLYKGNDTNWGTVLDEPDGGGFVTLSGKNYYGGSSANEPRIALLLNKKNSPSLYRGGLVF